MNKNKEITPDQLENITGGVNRQGCLLFVTGHPTKKTTNENGVTVHWTKCYPPHRCTNCSCSSNGRTKGNCVDGWHKDGSCS